MMTVSPVAHDREPLVQGKPFAVETGKQFGRHGHPLVIFDRGALVVLGKRRQQGLLRDRVFIDKDAFEIDAPGDRRTFGGTEFLLRQDVPVEQDEELAGLRPCFYIGCPRDRHD